MEVRSKHFSDWAVSLAHFLNMRSNVLSEEGKVGSFMDGTQVGKNV